MSSGGKNLKKDPKLMAQIHKNLKARTPILDASINQDVVALQAAFTFTLMVMEQELVRLVKLRGYSMEEHALLIQRLTTAGLKVE